MRKVALIMAGGSGERFWPVSTASQPKQLLRLTDSGQTLLAEAIERIEPLVGAENVFVSTSERLADAIAADGSAPRERVLAEPAKRNTAGAILWSTAELLHRYGELEDLVLAIVTADHRIHPAETFRRTVASALQVAETTRGLVVIGIKPIRPETGYGYIEVGDESPALGALEARPVVRFTEKPDLPTAEVFLSSGNYFWNSGMFFWTVSAFRKELETAAPIHAAALEGIADALRRNQKAEAVSIFEGLPNLSIDYALMERSSNVYVIEASFEWDDLGAWDSLARSLPLDDEANATLGDVRTLDTRGCVLYNTGGKRLSVLGMQDAVVVVTEDEVLVMPKQRSQDVRKLLQ